MIQILQILLVLCGLFVIFKGDLNLSKSKRLVRPQSSYLGALLIAYGISTFIISPDNLDSTFYALLYGSLVIILLIFSVKAKKVGPIEGMMRHIDTLKWVTFIGLVIIVGLVFYTWAIQSI